MLSLLDGTNHDQCTGRVQFGFGWGVRHELAGHAKSDDVETRPRADLGRGQRLSGEMGGHGLDEEFDPFSNENQLPTEGQ
jgi:hypothetical protein